MQCIQKTCIGYNEMHARSNSTEFYMSSEPAHLCRELWGHRTKWEGHSPNFSVRQKLVPFRYKLLPTLLGHVTNQSQLEFTAFRHRVYSRNIKYIQYDFASPPAGVRNIAISESACLFVCLPALVSQKPNVQISPNILYMLSVTVAVLL